MKRSQVAEYYPGGRNLLLIFVEEVFIDALEFDGATQSNTYTVFNHQFSEALPIDQNHPLG
jgi:hypothetical protein